MELLFFATYNLFTIYSQTIGILCLITFVAASLEFWLNKSVVQAEFVQHVAIYTSTLTCVWDSFEYGQKLLLSYW